MRRTRLLVVLALALTTAAVTPVVARAIPTPEPNIAGTILARPCTADPGNTYEAEQADREHWRGPEYERYPGVCQRLHFSFGPILVKPGQNDVLVEPVVLEKPWYDGYVTRFKPDLVYEDGTVPPIEQVHLHHGTWLSVPTYGSGPFFAAGEEKTIAFFPRGYGMPVKATDQWALLYMVHSAIPQPKTVYITYDIDYIAKKDVDAGRVDLEPVYPVWLDVETGGYPVFNTQRAFGGDTGTCTYPAQQCASFDPWGKVRAAQGRPADRAGADFTLPQKGGQLGLVKNFQGGTLIGIGGHLHPGGLTNDIDVVRAGTAKRVYTSEANYWDHADHTRTGGPPTSWDFSMTVTGLPRWGIHVEPGDKLRSNATYDTTFQSTYENMGIAIALLAPDAPDGTPTAPGVDPFTAPFDGSSDCASGGLEAPEPTLCDKGVLTHGHLKENDNYGGPDAVAELTDKRAGQTSRVDIGGFLYTPGDLSMVSMTGLPTVKLGSTLTFGNEDAALDIFHTATSCRFPCTGATGTAFPLGNGRTSAGREVDFDSGQLGFGAPYITGAKNELQWGLPVTAASGFAPGEVVTFYCRIHPFMRGGFEVVQ